MRSPRSIAPPLFMTLALLLTLLATGASIGQVSTASRPRPCIDTDPSDVITADPISGVGHGAMLNAAGKPIEVTPEFVLEAQRFYMRTLLHQADSRQRATFRTAQKRLLEGTSCDQAYQVSANSSLLAWLIDKVKPENAVLLARINTVLRENVSTAHGARSAHFAPSARTSTILRQEGMLSSLTAAPAVGSQYEAECRAAGVPIPPDPLPTDWTVPSQGSWQRQGRAENGFRLEPNFLKKEEFPDAYVFTYVSTAPPGLCIALPRTGSCDATGSTDCIHLLGIICQGNAPPPPSPKKACFWDNLSPSGSRLIIAKGERKVLADFSGGPQLHNKKGDICTSCHAGENAFLVHPTSALDQGGLLQPASWYKPLVHPDWPQNAGPTTLPLTSCVGCHQQGLGGRFPQMWGEVRGYCGILSAAVEPVDAAKMIGRTMPPPPFTLSSFQGDIAKLKACDEDPRRLAADNRIILGNSPARSYSPCFGLAPGASCPVGKITSFLVPALNPEIFVTYDLGQSHGCCADHAAGILRILVDGVEVHRDETPYLNYGVRPISEFLEDFDFFFAPEVVKGHQAPLSKLDPTRVGPFLDPSASYKIVRRLSLGKLGSGGHTVELQVGDAGWNSMLEISQ